MTKMTEFNRTSLKSLRKEMQAVLDKYGVSANVDFEVGNMSFTAAEVNIKVKAKIVGAKTAGDAMLESVIHQYGLKKTNSNGDTLVEYKARNRKYPFIYENKNGTRYKCDMFGAKTRFAA